MQASRERGIDHGIIWSPNGRARDLHCLSDFDTLRDDVAALERLLNDPKKPGDSNDNNNLVYHYAPAFCALKDGENLSARAALNTVMDMLLRIKRPQVYMIQNVDYYSDIIWNPWHRGYRDPALMAHQKLAGKSGRQVAKQYRTGAPMALVGSGDGAWYRGKAGEAQEHWTASAQSAQERNMPYCAVHALFRLAQAGIKAQDWRPFTDKIEIGRP